MTVHLVPIATGLVALAAAAESAEQPTAKWHVDYGETQCVAMRAYGKRTLVFRSAPNGESYEVMLLEPGLTGKYALQSPGSLSFGGEPIKSTVLIYSDRKSRTKIFKFQLRAADMLQARTAVRISLRARRAAVNAAATDTRIGSFASGGSGDFALAQMPVVLDQMEKCTADLRKYWNDGEPTIIATPVKGDIRGLFSADDYPDEALRRDQGGTTQAILLIDEAGKVASCYNSLPSGVASVDAMSCQVIRERARFSPALDAQGKPVRSIYYSPRITFRLQS